MTSRWRRFFAWLAEAAGVDLHMAEMPPPAQLPDIWSRRDLGCAFMCALPFSGGRFDVQPLAAPVPCFPRYESRPVYATDFIVRHDSPIEALEDLRQQGPLALMPRDSLSGFRSPVAHLAERLGEAPLRHLLRSKAVQVQTPREVLQAVAEGQAAVGVVDTYFFDLCAHPQMPLAQNLRSIATTPWLPISPLVASGVVDGGTIDAIRAALLRAGEDAEPRALLEDLGLSGFAEVDRSAYTEAVGARFRDGVDKSLISP
ncbi:phosphate/phosphite/phosphonate ABC transporter substrate-binding protein [Fodinicurvata halophila]|uniref:phosphate/phosphite/phosphonate ABC transporter substrate-binding protein n=1 Tax=Fodinicurvata halophila TaxID=1419723 RepID=UPI003643B5E3